MLSSFLSSFLILKAVKAGPGKDWMRAKPGLPVIFVTNQKAAFIDEIEKRVSSKKAGQFEKTYLLGTNQKPAFNTSMAYFINGLKSVNRCFIVVIGESCCVTQPFCPICMFCFM